MNEPLTLWDRGMTRAREAADEAGEEVTKNVEGARQWTWVSYDWDDNEIEIGLIVSHFRDKTSHENCNKMRQSFISALAGIYPIVDQEMTKIFMRNRIDHWFSHSRFKSGSRDEKLAEKLARIIFVKARLDVGFYESGVECRARIMTIDAPSKPWGAR